MLIARLDACRESVIEITHVVEVRVHELLAGLRCRDPRLVLLASITPDERVDRPLLVPHAPYDARTPASPGSRLPVHDRTRELLKSSTPRRPQVRGRSDGPAS